MIYLTQLIYIDPLKEKEFQEFESHAIPLIKKYHGELLLRLRPSEKEVISSTTEIPYEIHLVSFPDEDNFEKFKNDPERKSWLPLKEVSVRDQLLIQGSLIG